MMNRLLPIAASLLLSFGMTEAKTGQRDVGTTPVNDSISISASISSDTVGQLNADIVVRAGTDSASNETAATGRLVNTDEGDSYIIFKGNAYQLQEIVDGINDGLAAGSKAEDIADQQLREIGTWGVLGILAICFGFPALVVIVAIVLIIGFFRNRNRERNALIAQAIDHGYQLPDAFYANQQSADRADNPTASAPSRDPQKFNTSMTLIAVGLCVGVFFWAVDAPFGFVAGGIPLLLGIGRLIGYFYVPGYGAPDRHNYRDARWGRNSRNNGPACPPPPPGERFYYDPRDPRYNGKA